LLLVALDTTFRLVGAAALFLFLVLLIVFDLVAFFLTIGQMKYYTKKLLRFVALAIHK
jgi:hypothetical protein